ncbi:uncharacterized protein C8Q71DRAFT_267535 [Rhodofomes roseus]|uniref:Dynamin family protein n=1 Tax=Rhodofomes roseus TaxID=34475 RepID=A0ABQ8K686_9APHY|nr:uncharacterized protein C8Q71DRAFT_267535 [Rhodofomes roseus]KAH9832231.1 hypothetical protein C8Q71DRAFT_267535 [Rhodofomes roseus]
MVKKEPIEHSLDSRMLDDLDMYPRRSLLGHQYTIYQTSRQIEFEAERAMSECLRMADAIGQCIDELNHEVSKTTLRTGDWQRSLQQVYNIARQKTLIAVCGATGSGKSSLINAILDLPLVPTDGSQACTSVITEIAWHEDTSFLAEIVFLSEEEWLDELKPLLLDLQDTEDPKDAHEDLLPLWHKLRAVYPSLAGCDDVKKVAASIKEYVSSDAVTYSVLGTTRTVREDDKARFTEELQQFVAAARQTYDEEAGDPVDNVTQNCELWPLIKVIKIHCNSPALSSGSVLVDLPGTADTNSARANIATKYLTQCSHIWIVTSIVRAPSDKNAKDLTDDAFRAQLCMDGAYDDSRITLIASKTDQVSPSEVLRGRTMGSEDAELQDLVNLEIELGARMRALEIKGSRKPGGLAPRTQPARHTADNAGSSQKRRKSISCGDSASKKTRVDTMTIQHSSNSHVSDASTSGPRSGQVDEQPASAGPSPEIDARDYQAEIDSEEIRTQLKILEMDQNTLFRRKRVLCSRIRSKESTRILQHSFIQHLKELDNAVAEANDPDNYDPSEPLRDYRRINPPVFTCSALDYMRIYSHIVGDGEPYCFSEPDDTGIPQIQQWCYNLGHVRRRNACPGLLTRLSILVESIRSYSEDVDLSDVAKANSEDMRKLWQTGLAENTGIAFRLKAELYALAEAQRQKLQARFSVVMKPKCRAAAPKAAQRAEEISDSFAANMFWSTYRGTLRRYGSWYQDLNINLATPFLLEIAPSWSRTFRHSSIDIRNGVVTIVEKILTEVKASATPLLKALTEAQAKQSRKEVECLLDGIEDTVQAVIDAEQKDASRRLASHISEVLAPGYAEAAPQAGKGSAARRKAIFRKWLVKLKYSAFYGGAAALLASLDDVADAVGDTLEEEFDALSEKVEATMSLLWDRPGNGALELKACARATATMAEIREQILLWQLAAESTN